MRTFRVEGIVIKRRNFGEADRILTVITRDLGKIHIKASGVRKITSRRSAHVELLNNSILGLYKGNGFPILTEAKMLDDFSSIKSDLNKMGLAYHLCELVDGLCPENQEQYAVFNLLKKTLQRFSQDDEIAIVVHEFEIELLSILGYWNQDSGQVAELHDAPAYIESIIERKLKSKNIFDKLQ